VNPLEGFLETFAVADTMKHKAKSPFQVKLGDEKIGNRQRPPPPSFQPGCKKNDGRGHHGEVDTGKQVDKREIPLVVHDPDPETVIP
jgi:hypothetical protein